jgi:hypothetical protein
VVSSPEVQVFEAHKIVFRWQCRNPEFTVPHQFAQHRLIPIEVVLTDGGTPILEEILNLGTVPEGNHAAIKLRKSIWQNLTPEGMTPHSITDGIMCHGHIEPIQNLEHVSNIRDYKQIHI